MLLEVRGVGPGSFSWDPVSYGHESVAAGTCVYWANSNATTTRCFGCGSLAIVLIYKDEKKHHIYGKKTEALPRVDIGRPLIRWRYVREMASYPGQ